MQGKPVRVSICRMNELVMPNDTNPNGTLMGGRLLYLMDICGAIAAQRHANTRVTTVSVDFVEFRQPIYLGEIIVLEGRVNRAFTTSMEVEIDVWAENPLTGERRRSNKAFYTFVGIDEQGHPTRIPPVIPETDLEKKRYHNAARRRELRLIMAGRLRLEEAVNLRDDLQALLEPKSEEPTNP